MRLQELIHQDHFEFLEEEVILNVVVTSTWIMTELSSVISGFGLTPAQYNILRILKGSDPAPLTCGVIGSRLLDRTPDVTRLVDRLKKNGLVHRERSNQDRRVVEISITDAGIEVLASMKTIVDGVIKRIVGDLGTDEQKVLIGILEKLRTAQSA